jgi:hypothetical protein
MELGYGEGNSAAQEARVSTIWLTVGYLPASVQFARPASDQSVGSWTPTPSSPTTLYDKIDESSANDSDYIESPDSPSAATTVVKLSGLGDPLSSANHTLRYRYQKNASTGSMDLTVQLRQGTTEVIAEWIHTNISNAWTTTSQTLTTDQADYITDYSNLHVAFIATQTA